MKPTVTHRVLALAAAAAAAAALCSCGADDAGASGPGDGGAIAATSVSVDPDAPELDEEGTTYNFVRSYDDGRMLSLGHAATASADGWTGVVDSAEPQFSSLPEGVYAIMATAGGCAGAGESVGDGAQVIGELHVADDGTVTVHNRPSEIDPESVSAVFLADGDEIAACGRSVKWTRPTASGSSGG